MAKRTATTKRGAAKVTRTVKLLTWRRGRADDVLARVDTFPATEAGIARLEAAVARRVGPAYWGGR